MKSVSGWIGCAGRHSLRKQLVVGLLVRQSEEEEVWQIDEIAQASLGRGLGGYLAFVGGIRR